MRIFLTSHACLTLCSGNCNDTSDNWNQSLFSISVPQQPEYLAQKKGNPVNELEMLWWHKNTKLPQNQKLFWGNYCPFISHVRIVSSNSFSRVPSKGSTQDPVEVSQIFPFIPCLNSPLSTTMIALIFYCLLGWPFTLFPIFYLLFIGNIWMRNIRNILSWVWWLNLVWISATHLIFPLQPN